MDKVLYNIKACSQLKEVKKGNLLIGSVIDKIAVYIIEKHPKLYRFLLSIGIRQFYAKFKEGIDR